MPETKDTKNKEFYVSVVIPVFNDFKRLHSCLSALESQTYARDMYEVIVVDNGSTDDISQIVQEHPKVKFYNEPKRGSYAARNKGIANSKADIIAFTDSDCIPSSDWLEMGVKTLRENPECGLIGGKIELFYNNPLKLTAVELWESVMAFDQKRYTEHNYAATANVFTFRKVICKVGEFNSELLSSGDQEWGKRVAASGYKILYAEEVKVFHPARRTLREFYSKRTRIISGHYKLNLIDSSSKALLMNTINPVIRINHFLFHPKLREINGRTNKLKVVFVMLFNSYIEVWQILRCKLKDWLKNIF